MIDILRKVLKPEEYAGFLKGNILKYRLRAGRKSVDPAPDLVKADDYERMLHEFTVTRRNDSKGSVSGEHVEPSKTDEHDERRGV